MKILVTVKRVIDYNVQVRVKKDGSGVEKENVKMSMNPPDENAVEEALRIKESGKANEIIILSIGEEKCLSIGNSYVLRTSWVYSPYNKNFLLTILNLQKKYSKENIPLKVVDDQINNPTWTHSIAFVIDRAIKEGLNGLIHWGDFDWISRYDFAKKIADKFNLQSNLIEPIKTQELNQIAPRPLNGGLDATLAQNLLGIDPPKIDDCLKQIIENLK